MKPFHTRPRAGRHRGDRVDGRRLLAAPASLLIAGLIATVSSCGDGGDGTGDEATSSPGRTSSPSPGRVSPSVSVKTSTAGTSGEIGDVTVDDCIVDPTLGWPKAELTITNRSSKTSNYFVQVEFVDAANVRLGEGIAAASNVAPGQVVKTTAQGATDAAGRSIICRVTSVERNLAP